MRPIRFAFASVLLGITIASTAALAQTAYETQVYGGSGGWEFETECEFDFLRGLNLRSARVIDQVSTRCVDESTGRIIASNETYGGRGGTYATTSCRSGHVVKGLRGRSARVVDNVQLTCVEAADVSSVDDTASESIDTNYPAFGGTGGTFFAVRCGYGDAAVGIFGGAGQYVDRIGLLCRDTGY
jgi:hypothetical protein